MRGPVVSSWVPAALRVDDTSTMAVFGVTAFDEDLPPVFSMTRTSVMLAAGSTALTMSCRVSPAIATAVSASISTPVWPVVFAVLEHEGGLRLRGHDDGVMQTIDGSRTDALSQIPLELKQSLVADGALTGGALDAKLLKAFHNGSNRTRQLATQIAFGTAELKAWLDRYERYVALGFAAYNTGSGPKPWVAAQKNATSRAERCRQAASLYHQPTSAIRISEGTWICDPQMKGSGWAWRAKILDGQTGRSIRGYQYLRSVASNCPKPPTSVCSAKTQREPCSQPLTSKGTRLGILDKLFNPSLMRGPYFAVIRTAWPVLPDDGRPLRAVGTKLVLEPSAAWQ